MATVAVLQIQREAALAEVERLTYALRLAHARELLPTLTPGTDEHTATARHIAELEAAGRHLKKE